MNTILGRGRTHAERIYPEKSKYDNSLAYMNNLSGAEFDKVENIIDRFAGDAERELLNDSRMVSDPETKVRILEFARQHSEREAELGRELTSGRAGKLYGGSMKNASARALEADGRERFQRMIQIDAKQSFISREGDPWNDEP